MSKLPFQPLLSIIIPTCNRSQYLQETVNSLLHQVIDYRDEVEFLIADNASSDGTVTYLKETFSNDPHVKLHFFDEFVGIDDSFQRTAHLAKGKFVCLFGDDDYALPGFVGSLLKGIKHNPNIEFIHVARLIASPEMKNPSFFRPEMGLSDSIMAVSEFIPRFDTNPDFITTLIAKNEHWHSSRDFSKFDGYSFLAHVYANSMGGQCLHLASPLVVMRKSLPLWKKSWPKYFLVSRQRLLKWLHDDFQIEIEPADIPTKALIYNLLLAKASDYRIKDPFWGEALSYVSPLKRPIGHFIRYFISIPVAKYFITKFKT